jgi:DNA-binding beta-propeller fold protein YncE
MRYKATIVSCAALLLSASVLQAESVSATGKDDRVEWEVRANWKIDGTPLDIVHSLDGKMVFILDSQHRVLVYDNNGQLQGRIPVGEGVTAIDIAPQGESLYLIDGKDNSFTSVSMSYMHDIDVSGSPFKGKIDAPVTIAVFTDFE